MNGQITHHILFLFVAVNKSMMCLYHKHCMKDCVVVIYPFYERENGNVILRQRATKQTGNQFLSSEPNTEDASNSYA